MINLARLKKTDVTAGLWVVNRLRPERGLFKITTTSPKKPFHNGNYFYATPFGSEEVWCFRTRSFRKAASEEIAQAIAGRIQAENSLDCQADTFNRSLHASAKCL